MDPYSDQCPAALTLSVIGGKWKPTILVHLKDGPLEIGELGRLVPGISRRGLALQLRALEAQGIVCRTTHPRLPSLYSLSEYGRTLAPIIGAMQRWGERHARGTRQVTGPVRLRLVERDG